MQSGIVARVDVAIPYPMTSHDDRPSLYLHVPDPCTDNQESCRIETIIPARLFQVSTGRRRHAWCPPWQRTKILQICNISVLLLLASGCSTEHQHSMQQSLRWTVLYTCTYFFVSSAPTHWSLSAVQHGCAPVTLWLCALYCRVSGTGRLSQHACSGDARRGPDQQRSGLRQQFWTQ